jgi:hypothetical protein
MEGELTERISAFIVYIVFNFATIRGVVQTIYVLIIKTFPALDEKIDKIEKSI